MIRKGDKIYWNSVKGEVVHIDDRYYHIKRDDGIQGGGIEIPNYGTTYIVCRNSQDIVIIEPILQVGDIVKVRIGLTENMLCPFGLNLEMKAYENEEYEVTRVDDYCIHLKNNTWSWSKKSLIRLEEEQISNNIQVNVGDFVCSNMNFKNVFGKSIFGKVKNITDNKLLELNYLGKKLKIDKKWVCVVDPTEGV